MKSVALTTGHIYFYDTVIPECGMKVIPELSFQEASKIKKLHIFNTSLHQHTLQRRLNLHLKDSSKWKYYMYSLRMRATNFRATPKTLV